MAFKHSLGCRCACPEACVNILGLCGYPPELISYELTYRGSSTPLRTGRLDDAKKLCWDYESGKSYTLKLKDEGDPLHGPASIDVTRAGSSNLSVSRTVNGMCCDFPSAMGAREGESGFVAADGPLFPPKLWLEMDFPFAYFRGTQLDPCCPSGRYEGPGFYIFSATPGVPSYIRFPLQPAAGGICTREVFLRCGLTTFGGFQGFHLEATLSTSIYCGEICDGFVGAVGPMTSYTRKPLLATFEIPGGSLKCAFTEDSIAYGPITATLWEI